MKQLIIEVFMETLTLPVISIIVIALAIGTFAKGITGVGLPILAMPLMAGFFGVERAVLIMLIPSLVSNSMLAWSHRSTLPVFKQLWPFLLAAAVGGVLGSLILVNVSNRALSLFLAAMLGWYLLHHWRSSNFVLSPAQDKYVGPLAGMGAGLVQGVSSISSIVIAPYYHALGLKKEVYVGAISTTFLVISIMQIIAVMRLGIYTEDRVVEGLIALVPVIIFLPLGMKIAHKVSQKSFDRVLIALLVISEMKLLYDGLWVA